MVREIGKRRLKMWRCKAGTEKECNTAGELKKALQDVSDNTPLEYSTEVGVYTHDETQEKMLMLQEKL